MTAQAAQITLNGQTMGTSYRVKYIDRADGRLPAPQVVKAKVEQRLQQINAEMSTYLPDSAISQFNRLQSNDWFLLPPDFAIVLQKAVELHELTDGGLDVGLGALVNLWGFGAAPRRAEAPQTEEVSAYLGGMRQFEIAEESGMYFVRKNDLQLQLDLAAIAKGFGVDALVLLLKAAGIEDCLVEIGGELRGCGQNPLGQPWRVGIEHPAQCGEHVAVVALDELALATSGDYRNYYRDAAGALQTHVLDPKHGTPLKHDIASLSVIAEDAMSADGLATGLFALGADAALANAKRHNLAVCIISRGEGGLHTRFSPSFRPYLVHE